MFDKIQSTYFKRVTTGVLALFMTASSGFSWNDQYFLLADGTYDPIWLHDHSALSGTDTSDPVFLSAKRQDKRKNGRSVSKKKKKGA